MAFDGAELMRKWLCSLVCVLLPVAGWAVTPAYKTITLMDGLYHSENKPCPLDYNNEFTMCDCSVHVTYPYFIDLGKKGKAINAAIKAEAQAFVRDNVRGIDGQYCKYKVQASQDDVRGDEYSWFRLSDVGFENDNFFVLNLELGSQGYGASPGLYGPGALEAMVFDKKTGKLLSVKDLFGQDTAALNEYVIRESGEDECRGVFVCHQPDFISAKHHSWGLSIDDKRGVVLRLHSIDEEGIPIPARFIAHPEIKKLAKEKPDAR